MVFEVYSIFHFEIIRLSLYNDTACLRTVCHNDYSFVAVLVAAQHLASSQIWQVLFTPDVAYCKLSWGKQQAVLMLFKLLVL